MYIRELFFKTWIHCAFAEIAPIKNARLTLFFIFLGLDPSFLDDDDVREMRMAQAEKVVEPEKLGGSAASIFQSVAALERFATDGKGPSPMKKDNNPSEPKSPDWEWDGIVDEDAHMGWD